MAPTQLPAPRANRALTEYPSFLTVGLTLAETLPLGTLTCAALVCSYRSHPTPGITCRWPYPCTQPQHDRIAYRGFIVAASGGGDTAGHDRHQAGEGRARNVRKSHHGGERSDDDLDSCSDGRARACCLELSQDLREGE